MPNYRITAPDGRTFRVTAPEGTTQEEALARVQAQYAPKQSDADRADHLRREDPGEYDPKSPQWQAKYGATSGMSGADKFFAGAGKSVVDLGRGIKQLGAEAGNALGLVDDATIAELRAEQTDVKAQDAPLMKTGAGIAGNVAGTLATTVLPASLIARSAKVAGLARTGHAANAFANPTTYKAAAAAGAIQGALQPVATNESRAQNAATGAALGTVGQGAANSIGRLAQPLKTALNKEDAAAVKTLSDAGVPLDTAQRSGSKVADVIKRTVSDNPFTGPGQAEFFDKQQRSFTKAVLNTIGADADAATADVMGNASKRIGQVFDDVAERNPVKYDAKLHNDIAQLSQQAYKELESPQYRVISNQIEEIFNKAQDGNGEIIGKGYQNIKTALDRIMKEGGSKGYWAGELKEAIEDALQRSAKPDDLKALKEARTQYRRMKQIEGAIDNEGGGKISPAKLANALATKSNRAQSKYGRGDQQLVVLAQAGKKLLPDKFPNSGTAARAAGQLIAPAVLGLGAGYASGNPTTGIGTALGTAAALRGARGALNNQTIAKYLSEGLPQGATRNRLIQLQNAGLIGRQVPIVALPALQE